jgi:hypothetical protein
VSVISKTIEAASNLACGLRRFTCMWCLGGPVGIYHTIKHAHIQQRVRDVGACIDREKDLHRENLRTLNHQLTQLVMEQQAASQAAAEFWRWCEKKAGVQS